MAHELTIRDDNKVEMAYVGETPWHALGTRLPAGTPVPEWITAAGMDWTVETSPVLFDAGNGDIRQVNDRVVLHRSDTKAPLGVVTPNYNIINPGECLEFFDDLVHSVGLELETAGTMFGGRRFWALAKVGDAKLIGNQDAIKGYLLLSSSADGMRATEARFTSVRVVCNNTLRMSDDQDSEGQIKITHKSQWNADAVKRKLGVAPEMFENFLADMRRLADVRLTDERAEEETRKLFKREGEEIAGKNFDSVMALFRGLATGYDEPGFEGTVWGWLNCVTEYSDHGTRSKSESHRLYTNLWGPGDKLKTRAYAQALELA